MGVRSQLRNEVLTLKLSVCGGFDDHTPVFSRVEQSGWELFADVPGMGADADAVDAD